MTLLPPGVKVHVALGIIDMRKGIDGLAMLVQGVLRQDPFSGHLFVFRGRQGRPDQDRVLGRTGCACSPSGWSTASSSWPSAVEPGETLMLTSAAAVDADRRHRLARAGAAVAAGGGGIDRCGRLNSANADARCDAPRVERRLRGSWTSILLLCRMM